MYKQKGALMDFSIRSKYLPENSKHPIFSNLAANLISILVYPTFYMEFTIHEPSKKHLTKSSLD